MAALTTLLTGFHGLDGDHAAAAAWLICVVLGGAGSLVAWYMQRQRPDSPPIPKQGNAPP
jgi:hypothetical protein